MTSLKSPYGALQTTWSHKFFSAKRVKLILPPVKFQIHIIGKSINFERVKRGVYPPPHKAVTAP